MTDVETRTHARVLYPGILFAEEGRSLRVDPAATPEELVAMFQGDGKWFAIEVTTRQWRRWASDGREEWRVDGPHADRHHVYLGEAFTVDEIRATVPDSRTLAANLAGYGTDRGVRCYTGNWRPLLPGDHVVSVERVP